jgi:putative ABC transport system ATP-binding protein
MIHIQQLIKYFHRGSINEVLALDTITLDVRPGDFITVIGSNGAGKSTLLNCISGSFPPDFGKIFLDEKDITTWPEHKRAGSIGRVFQDPLLGTCSTLSIEQNLALARRRGRKRGLKRGVTAEDRRDFRTELKQLGLGLEDRLKDKVGLLSGGQRQALTMLMATMVQPELLLLDEHTAALDPKTGHMITDLTLKIVDRLSLTTLMVTHNMQQALSMGNRLVMLHQGRVILDIEGQDKQSLQVSDLLARFYELKGESFPSDRMLLV